MSNATRKEAFVLYVDHQGHPAPLQECYHATASRRLSSAVDRYPASTVEEVDSGFCPQCLAFHDAATAAAFGYCPKATCQQCPLCTTAVSINVQDETAFYQCGLCDWTSKECNLSVVVLKGDDGRYDKIELARALDDLGNLVKETRLKRQAPAQSYFDTRSKALEQHSKEEHQRHSRITLTTANASATSTANDGPEGWSVQALEATLQEKKQQLTASTIALRGPVERLSLDDDESKTTEALCPLTDVSALALQLQSLNHSTTPLSKADLLPLPMPLRVRTSRRCRAELAEGRPGILLKPKLNPMEGDSSLRSGHGQWWKKDSSAVHVIPRVRPVKHVVQNDKRIFLVNVTNPTLGTIRLRFNSSSYRGEVDQSTDAPSDNITTQLPNLLVDTISDKHVNAQLQLDVLKLGPTEQVELLSAEDSFIEFGGKSKEIPHQVLRWDPSESDAVGTSSSMRLVAKSASTAWFELTVLDVRTETSDLLPAVPLALQIEVGNGSWQSSLVQPQQTTGDEEDWVTFDLVLTWEQEVRS